MDRQAQRKALFRSKLRESSQNRDKRIDSPLVRYNENDQPVCRVCNVLLKSESLWPAHQASRKHHEAIENVKAAAVGITQSNKVNAEKPADLPKARPSPTLPSNFFDNRETKRQKDEHHLKVSESGVKTSSPANDNLESSFINSESVKSQPSNKITGAPKKLEVKQVKEALPDGFFDDKERDESIKLNDIPEPSGQSHGLESTKGERPLPEGFFDDKERDQRARGIEPVKVDVNDAYKEFEKEIQDDLQGVDDRLEEEEIDAAKVRAEFESLEQQAYRENVEMMKRQFMEVKAAQVARGKKSPAFKGKESSDESSSDDDDENFAVDWRAKHF
ncbi:zinc finger protein 830 isoform X2 [Asparagus officinalis]|uniref:zinc finger protein 830 isoform X2 n=1 Tax=Asparagus officinalis TaxID=4686 RepID=UPI00098E1753|nr:zinc finger protein 830 isoform X2 [Asparagus officinalis]